MKPRIAIVHPRFGWGGSEARALRGMEALRDRCDLTLITGGVPDWAALNAYHGTAVRPEHVALERVPMPDHVGSSPRWSALRGRYVQRHCRRSANRFDLMVSTYNVVEFGRPGLQFIADFSFDPQLRAADFEGHARPTSRLRDLAYRRLCDLVSPPHREEWPQHTFVANSNWTRSVLRDRYGIDARVLYPAVAAEPSPKPFEDRDADFVWVGRISPEKRLERAFRILARVRAAGRDVRLDVVGEADEPHYGRAIREEARRHGDWIRFHGRLAGPAKAREIVRHRFALSTRPREPFGIAVAEFVGAGCIPFVPDAGGQAEVVAHDDLWFSTDAQAVERILRVLGDDRLQATLRRHLAERARTYSVERFVEGFRRLVADALERAPAAHPTEAARAA